MLIEIVFVRYRGLCDLLIYTIGFMNDDFFSVLHDSASKMDGGDNWHKIGLPVKYSNVYIYSEHKC